MKTGRINLLLLIMVSRKGGGNVTVPINSQEVSDLLAPPLQLQGASDKLFFF